ncbi:HTH-type transcriptional activator RhaS [bioreactor metagenome]|uniref:HTH-type transcriptional activator RhaS n=1 Tax=bioreactor metagenome TaxID=1076179 RepID=A0A645EB61_9ZZZZ
MVHFTTEVQWEILPNLSPTVLPGRYQDNAEPYQSLSWFLKKDRACSAYSKELGELYAHEILFLLRRSMEILQIDHISGDHRDALGAVLASMQNDLARNWTLEELARAAHMSVPSLIRHVRRRYETTPGRLLGALRLKRGHELLVSGQTPVGEIAFSVGYDNPSSFAYAFRRQYGMTPGECRKKYAIQEDIP